MTDVGLRDLGSVVPGARPKPEPDKRDRAAPSLDPSPPSSVILMPPPAAAPPAQILGADLAAGTDALGMGRLVAHLAELVAHKGTVSPLCIGLLGASGTGKSFALGKLVAQVRDLAAASPRNGGPYLSAIHIERIDAAGLDGDLATGLAAHVYAGLRRSYPELASEIGHAARDPHVVLREVNEKLDDARRRLDSERRTLDDAGSRRARLTESVLYEAAGSQVDAYARANRARIENRLVAFGIQGDPIRNYKDLVQLVAGSGGKIGLALRSLWAFKGQTKLIIAAIVLIGAGFGIKIALDHQTTWLDALRANQQAGAVAAWAQAHIDWLEPARTGVFVLAALAILANLWRAYGFLQPIFKGARLLEGDLDTRRHDLDGLYAHQTKRVDALETDVERLTRESAEAELRAGGAGAHANTPSPFEAMGRQAEARAFFEMLSRTISDVKGRAEPDRPGPNRPGPNRQVPGRLVLAIDHLDAVAPDRARAMLDTLHRLTGQGVVSLVATDPACLGHGVSRGELERWIQIPARIDAGLADRDYAGLVQVALGRGTAAQTEAKPDGRHSALDEPFGDDEVDMLTALAPLAGPSPRAVKRFVNLYALARLDGDHRGALALMLALAQGGTDAEMAKVAEALAAGAPDAPFALQSSTARLHAALDTASRADGKPINDTMTKAGRRAAIFSI